MKAAFLSSTARDLAKYREAAYKVIEGLDDWHCVRMEDFGARDAMPNEFCRRKVTECDVFVDIVGHCYGSIPKGSDKSYTEQEYDAAVATEKPRLMFLAPGDFPLPTHLIEPDEKWAKQRAFRDRVYAKRIRDTFTCYHTGTTNRRVWCDGPSHCYKPALEEAERILKLCGGHDAEAT